MDITWGAIPIETMDLGLSDRRPIAALRHFHEHSAPLLRDMHFALELGIVIRGRILRSYSGIETSVGPGQVWLCGIWEPHGWRVPRGGCEIVVCTFLPQVAARLRAVEDSTFDPMAPFVARPAERPQVRPCDTPRALDLARRTVAAIHEDRRHRQMWFHALLLEALLLLHENWRPRPSARFGREETSGRLNPAIHLALEGRGFVPAATAARACGLRPKTFHRAFVRLMGMSFADFAMRYRLQMAAAELRNGDSPIKAIAAKWGFADNSHLHHSFRKCFGCSPAEYRSRGRVSP